MRVVRSFAILVLAALSAAAAKKVISPTTTGSNEVVDLEATITLAQDEVDSETGGRPRQRHRHFAGSCYSENGQTHFGQPGRFHPAGSR